MNTVSRYFTIALMFLSGGQTVSCLSAQKNHDSVLLQQKLDSRLLNAIRQGDTATKAAIEITGNISENFVVYVHKLGATHVRAFPEFKQLTCEIRKAQLPLLVNRKEVRFIIPAPIAQLENP